MSDHLNTPGIPPSSRPSPQVPEEEVGGQAKPFSVPKESSKMAPQSAVPAETPKSPYELAREGSVQRWSESQMQENMGKLRDKLGDANAIFKDPKVEKDLTEDHYNALNRLVDKMNPDMKEIAKRAGIDLQEMQKKKEEGVIGYVVRWLNSSQETMSSALQKFGEVKNLDPSSYFKLQASVQRATERAELFASIVGSSVSGIKTLMSMQLG